MDSQDVGLPASVSSTTRELWTSADVPTHAVTMQFDTARGDAPGSSVIDLEIGPHGAVLLELR